MNHIELSGTITDGPKFAANDLSVVATFILWCGQFDSEFPQVVRVVARDLVAEQLKLFAEGDKVKVTGRLSWLKGTMEIFAEEFKRHREGCFQRSNEWRSRVIPKF
jgi:hypothetical protein